MLVVIDMRENSKMIKETGRGSSISIMERGMRGTSWMINFMGRGLSISRVEIVMRVSINMTRVQEKEFTITKQVKSTMEILLMDNFTDKV